MKGKRWDLTSGKEKKHRREYPDVKNYFIEMGPVQLSYQGKRAETGLHFLRRLWRRKAACCKKK